MPKAVIPPKRGLSQRALTAIGWAGVLVLCAILGEVGEAIGLPSPRLMTALIVGLSLALTKVVTRPLPVSLSRPAQAVVGMLIGSHFSVDALRAVAPDALALAGVTAATIVISAAIAVLMTRVSTLSLPDAALCMVPGGSLAIISSAEELNADARLVAIAQYLRLGLVTLTAPAVVFVGLTSVVAAVPAAPARSPAWPSIDQIPGGIGNGIILGALCLLGVWVGRWIRLPTPVLVGPMLVSVLLTHIHAPGHFAPTGPLKDLVFAATGLGVGLRFTPASLRRVADLLPLLLGTSVLVCVCCGALAWLLADLLGIPFVDAYLATTPGGINAVLATAESTSTNVALVSTVQSARLFAVVLAAPVIIRWLLSRAQTRPCDTAEGMLGSGGDDRERRVGAATAAGTAHGRGVASGRASRRRRQARTHPWVFPYVTMPWRAVPIRRRRFVPYAVACGRGRRTR